MILYLFGGSSPENDTPHRELIFGEIQKLNPAQFLFVGFGSGSQRGEFFKEKLKESMGPRFLDAALPEDLIKARRPLIFVAGKKMRREGTNDSPAMSGFGFLKGAVVEPHYTQRGRHQILWEEMKDWGCSIGVGIDEACGLRLDTRTFTKEYQALGDDLVEVMAT